MATLVLLALSLTALSATVLILEAGFRLLRLAAAAIVPAGSGQRHVQKGQAQ